MIKIKRPGAVLGNIGATSVMRKLAASMSDEEYNSLFDRALEETEKRLLVTWPDAVPSRKEADVLLFKAVDVRNEVFLELSNA